MDKKQSRPPVKPEVEAKPIRMDGVGEDPAIQALTSKEFLTNDDVANVDIAAAVVEILRGQKIQSEEIARMKQFYADEAKARRDWEENQNKFIQEQFDKADRMLKATGERRDKIIAEGMKMAEHAQKEASAERINGNLRFAQMINDAPKVPLTSPGKWVLTEVNGANTHVLIPEVISMKNRQWILPPNEEVMVPDFVAKFYHSNKKLERDLSKFPEQMKKFDNFDKAVKMRPEIDPSRAQQGFHTGLMKEEEDVKDE